MFSEWLCVCKQVSKSGPHGVDSQLYNPLRDSYQSQLTGSASQPTTARGSRSSSPAPRKSRKPSPSPPSSHHSSPGAHSQTSTTASYPRTSKTTDHLGLTVHGRGLLDSQATMNGINTMGSEVMGGGKTRMETGNGSMRTRPRSPRGSPKGRRMGSRSPPRRRSRTPSPTRDVTSAGEN